MLSLARAIPYVSSVGTFSAISTPPLFSTAFCGDRGVDDHGFDGAGLERVDGVRAFGVGPQFAGVGFFLAEFEPGRALLGADGLACEVGEPGDVTAFLDQDRLFGEVVGIREGDRLFAFRGDRRGGDHGFELALRDVAEDRFERGVLEFGRYGPILPAIASISSMSKPV